MGICMWPHWLAICLQHARSAWFKCASGRTQAIAGVTSGNRTAAINANWRIAFIKLQREDTTAACIPAGQLTRIKV